MSTPASPTDDIRYMKMALDEAMCAYDNEACTKCDASYWLRDGVHPTPAGHQLIADAWLELFEREILGK